MIEPVNPVRGEVWLINFEPSVGAEIRKIRPAVVISRPLAGRLPLRTIIPFTDWKPHYAEFEWFAEIAPSKSNGLTKVSAADCFQSKSVSIERFIRKIGALSDNQIKDLLKRVHFCID